MTSAPHPRRSLLGFAAPAWRRVAWAGGYALVAFGVVAFLERPVSAPAPAADISVPPPASADQPVRLALEATRAVERWAVRIDGREVAPETSSAQSWQATTSLARSASHELFVDLELAATDTPQPAAVRLTLEGPDGRRQHVWWTEEESLVERLVLPAAKAAP